MNCDSGPFFNIELSKRRRQALRPPPLAAVYPHSSFGGRLVLVICFPVCESGKGLGLSVRVTAAEKTRFNDGSFCEIDGRTDLNPENHHRKEKSRETKTTREETHCQFQTSFTSKHCISIGGLWFRGVTPDAQPCPFAPMDVSQPAVTPCNLGDFESVIQVFHTSIRPQKGYLYGIQYHTFCFQLQNAGRPTSAVLVTSPNLQFPSQLVLCLCHRGQATSRVPPLHLRIR